MKTKEIKTIVKFKKWNCIVEKRKYSNGRTALQLIDKDNGEDIATATVNLPEVSLADNEVIIKNYSENDGMLDALMKYKIIEPAGRTVRTRFVTVHVCKLLI